MSQLHFVYWLHEPHHTDPKTQGYVGITKELETRITAHRKGNQEFARFPVDQFHMTILFFNLSRVAALKKERELRPRANIGWNLQVGGVGARGMQKTQKKVFRVWTRVSGLSFGCPDMRNSLPPEVKSPEAAHWFNIANAALKERDYNAYLEEIAPRTPRNRRR